MKILKFTLLISIFICSKSILLKAQTLVDSNTDSQNRIESFIDGKLCSCVSAYPNPTTGNFKIRVAYHEGEEESSFVLYNLFGIPIIDLTEDLKSSRKEKLSFVEVNGLSLTSGIYLARLNKGNLAKTTKIFVIR